MAETITSMSNREWIDKHPLKLNRYLRRFHRPPDRPLVHDLLYHSSPDEGRKLIQNFDLSGDEKKLLLYQWLYTQPQITCGIFADQRMGKDALICRVFDDVIRICRENEQIPPRIVTLGNIRKPPFVSDEDMYFSFKNIPPGSSKQEVWIYCSEIETVLPAREGAAPENKLFSQLEGTMAQNHQKLFGCSKLAAKVDINFIRGMNCKLFKFLSPEKLSIEGVEREKILSPLGYWHLPKSPDEKSATLMVFDNQLFLVDYDLPDWWSTDYSEQFRDIPMDKVWDYVEVMASNGMAPVAIQTAVAQKFRKSIKKEEVMQHLGME